ncbi:hypothetical protein DdX_09804 [Ditylenchus destructor]|uniref:Uncharacterized protein n=1 Tax=Ditylenchus destructor TaxID=166010 RepID=A0AAD4MZA8_9BILA|nr:hypothetical protein DdX_09804 [Ditylenchus destructor]
MPAPLTLIVNTFAFFDRDGLEILTSTDNFVKRIVRKHFPSKPYYFMDDVYLDIEREEDGLSMVLVKYLEDENPANPRRRLTLDPHSSE